MIKDTLIFNPIKIILIFFKDILIESLLIPTQVMATLILCQKLLFFEENERNV